MLCLSWDVRLTSNHSSANGQKPGASARQGIGGSARTCCWCAVDDGLARAALRALSMDLCMGCKHCLSKQREDECQPFVVGLIHCRVASIHSRPDRFESFCSFDVEHMTKLLMKLVIGSLFTWYVFCCIIACPQLAAQNLRFRVFIVDGKPSHSGRCDDCQGCSWLVWKM